MTRDMTREEFDKLFPAVKLALRDTLDANDAELYDKIKKLSRFEILDIYLRWEGIYGYTQRIANICDIEE